MYLAGFSDHAITDNLTERGVPTRFGKKNGKRAVIQGKFFNQDCLNQKRQVNKGQRQLYYVENSHKGIVSKEVNKEAQIERARRNSTVKIIEFEESMMQNQNGKKPKKNKCGMYKQIG